VGLDEVELGAVGPEVAVGGEEAGFGEAIEIGFESGDEFLGVGEARVRLVTDREEAAFGPAWGREADFFEQAHRLPLRGGAGLAFGRGGDSPGAAPVRGEHAAGQRQMQGEAYLIFA